MVLRDDLCFFFKYFLFILISQTMDKYKCGDQCQPPQRHEVVHIPHYVYTMHKQNNIDNWLTHQINHNAFPVTQEVRNMEHPSTSRCLSHPPDPCRRAPPAVCTPPLHSEQVMVPHHIYTKHSQPMVHRWMTRDVSRNPQPVTQEVRSQAHPILDSCPNNF